MDGADDPPSADVADYGAKLRVVALLLGAGLAGLTVGTSLIFAGYPEGGLALAVAGVLAFALALWRLVR